MLPRTLWKLSSMEDSSPCHILLEILSNIAKYLGDNEAISASLLQIQGELCPFYGTEISCPKYESVSERRIRCRQPARMSMGGKCSDPLPKAFSTRIPYLPAKTQAISLILILSKEISGRKRKLLDIEICELCNQNFFTD